MPLENQNQQTDNDLKSHSSTQTESTTENGESPQPTHNNPNAEAAKWRVKLRETEKQLEELAAQHDAFKRGVIAKEFEKHGTNITLAEVMNADLDSFFDEGAIDSQQVEQFIKNAMETLGVVPKRRGGNDPVPSQGTGDPRRKPLAAPWEGVISGY